MHAAAFGAFLIAALWTSRAVLLDPAAEVTLRTPAATIWASDVTRNVFQISYASRALSTEPWNFFAGQMCYPLAAGVALGEHMLGEGILGIPAHLLWDDPVVTFNFVVTVRPLLGALSMYALAFYWTRSFGAALIAGFLFGFHPMRLNDLVHPSVVGNELIPAILLALHRLFARRRWRDVVVLASLAGLQMLASLYVVLQLVIAVGVYGIHLLWSHRRSVPELLPKLAVVAVLLAGLAIWVFGPYLETRETWGVLQGRKPFPTVRRFVGFGNHFFPGVCLLFLALLGLLDRLRGRETDRGSDPRLPFAIIGVVAIWFILSWRVPWSPWVVPSLFYLLLPWIPGLDGVRAPANVYFVLVVSLGLLAAYGARALVEKVGPVAAKPRAILVGIVSIACVAEVFLPALATRSFGRSLPSTTFRVRPAAEDLAAVASLPPGAVLDFPFNNRGAGVFGLRWGVLLGAYHERRLAACMASFITPVQDAITEISQRLPGPRAVQELWSLGLRTISFSRQDTVAGRKRADRIVDALADRDKGAHLVPLGEGRTIRVFEIAGGAPFTTEVSALAPVVGSQTNGPAEPIQLRFGLQSIGTTFRHPDPVQPTVLVVTWSRDEKPVRSKRARSLLPLALAPGRRAEIAIEDRSPQDPGRYSVTLALADGTNRVVGKRHVVVTTRRPRRDPPRPRQAD